MHVFPFGKSTSSGNTPPAELLALLPTMADIAAADHVPPPNPPVRAHVDRTEPQGNLTAGGVRVLMSTFGAEYPTMLIDAHAGAGAHISYTSTYRTVATGGWVSVFDVTAIKFPTPSDGQRFSRAFTNSLAPRIPLGPPCQRPTCYGTHGVLPVSERAVIAMAPPALGDATHRTYVHQVLESDGTYFLCIVRSTRLDTEYPIRLLDQIAEIVDGNAHAIHH